MRMRNQKEGKTRKPLPIYIKRILEYEALYILKFSVTKMYRVTVLISTVWKTVTLENENRALTSIQAQQYTGDTL